MKRLMFSFLISLCCSSSLFASTIVYKPVIPSFGGDPNNWYGLLNEADKQNIYHPSTTTTTTTTTPVEQFQKQLQYLILSKLATLIANAAFGQTENAPEGTYNIGNYQIQVQSTGTEIQVQILDTTSGSSTTVEVPMYNTSP
jgi:curli production assembly/transport component CsgF